MSTSSPIEALSTALASFGKVALEGIEEANKLADLDTADMFTEVPSGIDKWLWLLEAHAQSGE
jgi:DNA-binding ferritin-like protein